MKVLKNVTASPVPIQDCGLTIPALSSYTTTPGEWNTLASSPQLGALILAGTIVVRDEYEDFDSHLGLAHIQEGGVVRDHNLDLRYVQYNTSASTIELLTTSPNLVVFYGTATGQIIKLPDARTMIPGRGIIIQNESSEPINIQDNTGVTNIFLNPQYRVTYYLGHNDTQAGLWLRAPESTAALSGTAPLLAYYGGNANTGRYLEVFPGSGTDIVPFLIVVNQRLVALSLSASSISTGTVSVYKFNDLTTPIASISLTNQDANQNITLSVPLAALNRIAFKVSSGSITKPSLAAYIST